MQEKNDLDPDFLFLSDPQLVLAEELDVPVGRLHPKAFSYPRRGFLQPTAFIFDRDRNLRFEWRINPGILNLGGAIKRLQPDEVLEELKKLT